MYVFATSRKSGCSYIDAYSALPKRRLKLRYIPRWPLSRSMDPCRRCLPEPVITLNLQRSSIVSVRPPVESRCALAHFWSQKLGVPAIVTDLQAAAGFAQRVYDRVICPAYRRRLLYKDRSRGIPLKQISGLPGMVAVIQTARRLVSWPQPSYSSSAYGASVRELALYNPQSKIIVVDAAIPLTP